MTKAKKTLLVTSFTFTFLLFLPFFSILFMILQTTPTTYAFCILKFAQHSRPQEALRPLPCCAVAVILHAHMQLTAASPYEFSWQLFNIFVFTFTRYNSYGHSIRHLRQAPASHQTYG